MTRNLSLVLTTSVLALTLVQHSAYAGGNHHPDRRGAASAPARKEHAAPRSAASHREQVAISRPNHAPAAGLSAGSDHGRRRPALPANSADPHLRKEEINRAASRAIDRPPPHAAFTSRIETPPQAGPGTQHPVEPRSDVHPSLSEGSARDLRVPADVHGVVGPAGGAPRMSNPAAEKSLNLEARTLLRPNRNGTIEQSAMDRYVALNNAAGNTTTMTPATGRERFGALLGKLNGGIRTGDYRVVPLTAGHGPAGAAGNSRTIVVGRDDNGKTIYVPASQLSGPDRRTINVNCSDCKVVVVGDTANGGRGVQDDRRIVVNGRGDDVVDRGDRANGGAGRNGGTVTDDRRITVNGSRDDVTSGGDSANGGNGRTGRNGGSGGAIDDNRSVGVNGSRDKVTFGTNSADGGNGGRGGGNGGNGGAITDHRGVRDNGANNRVKAGGDRANGGNGGNGF